MQRGKKEKKMNRASQQLTENTWQSNIGVSGILDKGVGTKII